MKASRARPITHPSIEQQIQWAAQRDGIVFVEEMDAAGEKPPVTRDEIDSLKAQIVALTQAIEDMP